MEKYAEMSMGCKLVSIGIFLLSIGQFGHIPIGSLQGQLLKGKWPEFLLSHKENPGNTAQ